jgi:hypothetical protein
MNTNKSQNPQLNIGAVISLFSIGDTVNYCNGLIFEVASINKKTEICYDKRGMWYALVNCVKVS